MPHYATLKEYRFDSSADDVRGAKLRSENGENLGFIRDVVFDHATGDICYLLVESDYDRCVLVPLDRVFCAVNDDSFRSDLLNQDLNQLPAFDEKILQHDRQWHAYEKLHRSTMQHHGQIDQSLVSVPQDILVPPGDRQFREEFFPRSSRPVALNHKWNTFAERIKQDLRAIRGYCERCDEQDSRAA